MANGNVHIAMLCRRVLRIFLSPTQDTDFLTFDSYLRDRDAKNTRNSMQLITVIATFAVFEAIIQYTISRVIATILILECTQQHPNADINTRTRRPVTSSIWTTLHYLHGTHGLYSLLKGLSHGIAYTVAYKLFMSLFTCIFTNTVWVFLSHISVAVLVAGLHMSWTHAVIRQRSSRAQWVRPKRQLAIPTVVHTCAYLASTSLPTYLGSWILDPDLDSKNDAGIHTIAARDIVAVVAAIVIQLLLLYPTYATKIICEIEQLSEKEQMVIPTNKDNDGRGHITEGKTYWDLLVWTAKTTTLRLVYLHIKMSLILLVVEFVSSLAFRSILQVEG